MSGISTRIYAANVTALENKALYHEAYYKVTDERRKKTDSLHFLKDKQLSLGVELLLSHGLKQWGINLNKMNYCYGANGKPYLTGRQDVYFNLSHSEEAVLCAISFGEIGCDIEKISDIYLKTAKKYFCESEYKMIVSQKTPEAKREMFFRLWTLKESFIKLTGMGLHLPMNSFDIELGSDTIEVNQKLGCETCYFQETTLWKDYKCSVCGFDEKIGRKNGVSFEILNFYDILCHKEGPIADGRIPYDLRAHQRTS